MRQFWHGLSYQEPILVDEYAPCRRPSEAGTVLLVVAWLAMRPSQALPALPMCCPQKTLPTGIDSTCHLMHFERFLSRHVPKGWPRTSVPWTTLLPGIHPRSGSICIHGMTSREAFRSQAKQKISKISNNCKRKASAVLSLALIC